MFQEEENERRRKTNRENVEDGKCVHVHSALFCSLSCPNVSASLFVLFMYAKSVGHALGSLSIFCVDSAARRSFFVKCCLLSRL